MRPHRPSLATTSGVVCLVVPLLLIAQATRAQSYHYEPVPDRTVGIWVDSWTSSRLAVFRHQYGFSGALVIPDLADYDSARAAGFPVQSIMMNIFLDIYPSVIDRYDAGWYYVDEPVEHDCAGHTSGGRLYKPPDLAARRDFIALRRPASRFVISGYKRCSHLRDAGPLCDVMMYSSYSHWRKLTFSLCHVNMGWGDEWEAGWYPSSSDQRSSWTEMRRMFGSKFSMAWIHGGGDEYDLLLGHARNLGLTGIWLYHEGPIAQNRLEGFLAAAVKHGWLTKVDGPGERVSYASVLPALLNRRHVQTTWTSTWEIDIQTYQLERRSDVAPEFTPVAGRWVAGSGTTLTPHSYALTDSLVSSGGWWYRVVGVSGDGSRFPSAPVLIRVPAVVADASADSPVILEQNSPNPFNPTTVVSYQLPAASDVKLVVYDLLGREAALLVDEQMSAGRHEVRFDASRLPSGVYIYRLQAGGLVESRRMVFLK